MNFIEKVKIAETCRVYRARKRLVQSELGEICGLSQMTVSLIEREIFEHVSDETLMKVGSIVMENDTIPVSSLNPSLVLK